MLDCGVGIWGRRRMEDGLELGMVNVKEVGDVGWVGF